MTTNLGPSLADVLHSQIAYNYRCLLPVLMRVAVLNLSISKLHQSGDNLASLQPYCVASRRRLP